MPFVGRDGEVARLAEQLSFDLFPASRSKVVVLHGPAGVGKSALAAEVARVVAGPGGRVHWISMGDTPSAETAILRLLAECAAPRRAIVEAALMGEPAFSAELWRQCAENIQRSVIVLDSVGQGYGLPLVQALHPGLNQVIITSRHDGRCGDANAYLHAVRRLGTQDALRLTKYASCAEPDDGTLPAEHELVYAARGLPALLRIAGMIRRPPFTPPRLAVNSPEHLIALATGRLAAAEKDLLQRLVVWGPSGPFTLRSVETLLSENGTQADAQRILDGLGRYGLVHEVREGAFVLPSPLAEAVPPLVSARELHRLKGQVRAALLAAARDAAWDTAGLLDGRDRPLRHDQYVVRLTPDELAEHVDEFMALLPKGRPASGQEQELINALATLLAVRGDAHRLVALHRISDSATRRPWARPSAVWACPGKPGCCSSTTPRRTSRTGQPPPRTAQASWPAPWRRSTRHRLRRGSTRRGAESSAARHCATRAGPQRRRGSCWRPPNYTEGPVAAAGAAGHCCTTHAPVC